jgi:hypothetical protein
MAMSNRNELTTTRAPDRWTLIRDVAVFQLKLLVDGFRDLLLVPVSLVAGLLSLLKGGSRPGSQFYELLRIGRRSEHWINLFGAAPDQHEPQSHVDTVAADDIDDLVARVESFVIDEYRKGGITAQAKSRVDSALDALASLAKRGRAKKG